MKWKLIPKFRQRDATSWDHLEAVIKAIKDEPKRIYMGSWLQTDADGTTIWGASKADGAGSPACGTQGCIAGWMVTLVAPSAKMLNGMSNIETIAYRLLPAELRNDAYRLFHGSAKYQFPSEPSGTLKDQKRYARQVIANIRKFMAENKAALQAHKIDRKQAFASI